MERDKDLTQKVMWIERWGLMAEEEKAKASI